MTEEEWLGRTDFEAFEDMWAVVCDGSDRKLRLFAVAICRQFWDLFRDERSRAAVEMAERYADGLATEDERIKACLTSNSPEVLTDGPTIPDDHLGAAQYYAAEAATNAAMAIDDLPNSPVCALMALDTLGDDDARPRAIEWLRDIFGNPFRPVAFDPAWRTADVMLLARGIYEERAFDRMPILADALQDVGCDSDEILGHLRDPHAGHVRGCWALDLVLGKE
jgi:hypothetical protein